MTALQDHRFFAHSPTANPYPLTVIGIVMSGLIPADASLFFMRPASWFANSPSQSCRQVVVNGAIAFVDRSLLAITNDAEKSRSHRPMIAVIS